MTSEIIYLHAFGVNILTKTPILYLEYFHTYLVDQHFHLQEHQKLTRAMKQKKNQCVESEIST